MLNLFYNFFILYIFHLSINYFILYITYYIVIYTFGSIVQQKYKTLCTLKSYFITGRDPFISLGGRNVYIVKQICTVKELIRKARL